MIRIVTTNSSRRAIQSKKILLQFKSTHAPQNTTENQHQKSTNSNSTRTSNSNLPSHFAPQPPPAHGAPRLIRYPPVAEASEHIETYPLRSPASSYKFQRSSSTSRLFSYRNTLKRSTAYEASNSSAIMPGEGKSTSKRRKATKEVKGVDVVNGKIEHSHSHESITSALFGHSHSNHDHGTEGSAEEADRLIDALKGKGDRGSNITVVGLFANLILCGAKGIAGVALHSASLLADAAHSLSDTFSDLVTLFCWKMSQRPASQIHPLGYGKFETMGGLGVSVVLVGGALAIGMHSYGLLLEVLQPHLHQIPQGLQAIGALTGDIARAAGGLLHDHHSTSSAEVLNSKTQNAIESESLLDPNAMWFALISILVKEWLYHATLKIAREEKSSVLEANAIHHRSDSLSSGVTFLAIAGSYFGFPVLDPLGGLLVAGLIGKQGIELLINALADLSDRGVEPAILNDFQDTLQELVESENLQSKIIGWRNLRAVRSGVSTFVDVTLIMKGDDRLEEAIITQELARKRLFEAVKGVKEVRVHLDTQENKNEEK